MSPEGGAGVAVTAGVAVGTGVGVAGAGVVPGTGVGVAVGTGVAVTAGVAVGVGRPPVGSMYSGRTKVCPAMNTFRLLFSAERMW